MMENNVECPRCGDEFNALEAARRTSRAHPHYGATWTECHRAVDPAPDPDDVSIEYNRDGSSEVTTE